MPLPLATSFTSQGLSDHFFIRILGPQHSYTEICLPKGDVPTPELVAASDLLIVGGSHCSAYEDLPWINNALDYLPRLAKQGALLACAAAAQSTHDPHAGLRCSSSLVNARCTCWPALQQQFSQR